MDWASLQLWAEDEEKRIHTCLVQALRELIVSQLVGPDDDELAISGKLRPYLYRAKKRFKLAWTLQPEASSFAEEDSEKPFGHPDIRFSCNTTDFDQYDYDVECKLVRVKRVGRSWDYCLNYVTKGIMRFQDGRYAQSKPPMGAMIGYIQEGDCSLLLNLVNAANSSNGLEEIRLQDSFSETDITQLLQELSRTTNNLSLIHLWADFR